MRRTPLAVLVLVVMLVVAAMQAGSYSQAEVTGSPTRPPVLHYRTAVYIPLQLVAGPVDGPSTSSWFHAAPFRQFRVPPPGREECEARLPCHGALRAEDEARKAVTDAPASAPTCARVDAAPRALVVGHMVRWQPTVALLEPPATVVPPAFARSPDVPETSVHEVRYKRDALTPLQMGSGVALRTTTAEARVENYSSDRVRSLGPAMVHSLTIRCVLHDCVLEAGGH